MWQQRKSAQDAPFATAAVAHGGLQTADRSATSVDSKLFHAFFWLFLGCPPVNGRLRTILISWWYTYPSEKI